MKKLLFIISITCLFSCEPQFDPICRECVVTVTDGAVSAVYLQEFCDDELVKANHGELNTSMVTVRCQSEKRPGRRPGN